MHDRRQQNNVDSSAVVVSSSTDTSNSISGSSRSVGSYSSSGSSSDSNKSIRWCILQQEPIGEEDAISAAQPPPVMLPSATGHSPVAPPSPQSDTGSATYSTAGSIAGGSSSVVGRKRGRSRSRANSDLGGDIVPLKYLLRRYVHRVGSKDTVNTDNSSAIAVVTTEDVAGDMIHDKVVPTEQTEVSEEDDIDWRDHFRQVWVMRCAMPAWWERRHAAKRALLQSSSYSFRQQSETRSSSSHGNILVSSSSVYRSESIFSTSQVSQEQ